MNLQVAVMAVIWTASVSWGVLSGVAADEPDRPPNIILMMADDLGVHDLASYGQCRFPTPHTDRLAREGMQFTDAHSPGAICSPTRYAVVTGTDPFRRYHTSHVLFNGEPLVIGEREATVASLLKQQGYRTGVVGKWHLGLGDTLPRNLNRPGRGPNDIGFDDSYLVPDGHNMLPRYYLENGRAEGGTAEPFRSKVRLLDRVGYKLVQNEPVGNWKNRRPDHEIGARLADRVDAFLERNREGPFFLFYPTCSIHFPTTPDPRFIGQSGIGPHGDYVMEFDWAVGRVLATLDRLGLADDTLLIVTSDNGGYPAHDAMHGHNPNDPWRGAKSSAFEGGHRVPLLVHWSGRVAPGTTSDQTVSLVDMTATFCALADAPLPADAALDSFDLSPILLGKGGEEPLRPYTVMGTRGMAELVLRRGPWKLILAPERNRVQLYRLDDDPREERDLSGEHPEIVDELRGLLGQYVGSGCSRPGAEATGTTLESLFRQRDRRNKQLLDLEANGFSPIHARQLETN